MAFTVLDRQGRSIRLTARRLAHVRRRHPNVRESAIKATVEAAQWIFASRIDPTTEVQFRKGVDPAYDNLYCKVIVAFQEPKQGTVLSAMYTDEVRGVGELKSAYVTNAST